MTCVSRTAPPPQLFLLTSPSPSPHLLPNTTQEAVGVVCKHDVVAFKLPLASFPSVLMPPRLPHHRCLVHFILFLLESCVKIKLVCSAECVLRCILSQSFLYMFIYLRSSPYPPISCTYCFSYLNSIAYCVI